MGSKGTSYIYDQTVGKDVPYDEASEEAKEVFHDHMAKVGKVFGMSELWRRTGYKFRFVDQSEEISERHVRGTVLAPFSIVSVKPTSNPESGLIQIDYDEDGQWYYMVTPARKIPYSDHEMKFESERLRREAYKRRMSNK